MSDIEVRLLPEHEARERLRALEADRRKGREHLRDLTIAEADLIVADLRAGRLKRLNGVRFPMNHLSRRHHELSGVVFETVDLAFSGQGKKGNPATFTDCEFIDTRIDPWLSRYAVYRGCTFSRVRAGTLFGSAVTDSVFESCRFVNSRISDMGFTRTRFTDVEFVQLAGARTKWESCTLTRVAMTGRLGIVHLIDCEFEDVDLSQMHLPNATIMDVRRNGLLLPEFRDGFFIARDDLYGVLATIRDDLGPRGRSGIDRFLALKPSLSLDVINESLIRTYVKASKDEARWIVDRLYPHRVAVPPVSLRPERRRRWWQRQ